MFFFTCLLFIGKVDSRFIQRCIIISHTREPSAAAALYCACMHLPCSGYLLISMPSGPTSTSTSASCRHGSSKPSQSSANASTSAPGEVRS